MNLVNLAIAIHITGMTGAALIPAIPPVVSWWDHRDQHRRTRRRAHRHLRRAARAVTATHHPANRSRLISPAGALWDRRDTRPPNPMADPDVRLARLWTDLGPELREALDGLNTDSLAPDPG